MKFSRNHLQTYLDVSALSDEALLEGLNRAGWQIGSCEETPNDRIWDLTGPSPDCACLEGLIRDIAAIFGLKKTEVPVSLPDSDAGSVFEHLDADAEEICNRYSVRMAVSTTVKPSPRWLQELLLSLGRTPRNNFADIGVLTQLETGQKLRFLDGAAFGDCSYQVRAAFPGETEIPGLPVYADENWQLLGTFLSFPAAELTENTKTVILEAVSWNRDSEIPGVLRSLGDADPLRTVRALDRACQLIEQLDCGQVLDGTLDLLNFVPQSVEVSPDLPAVNSFLNRPLSREELQSLLAKMGLSPDQDTYLVPPLHPELRTARGLAEEILRLFSGNAAAFSR